MSRCLGRRGQRCKSYVSRLVYARERKKKKRRKKRRKKSSREKELCRASSLISWNRIDLLSDGDSAFPTARGPTRISRGLQIIPSVCSSARNFVGPVIGDELNSSTRHRCKSRSASKISRRRREREKNKWRLKLKAERFLC